MVGETISENASASGSSKWDILKDYDAKQQRILNTQVDYLRGKRVGSGPLYSRERKFEKNGIEKQPTLLRKLGRAVMLATFGLPKREEERMYREAMPAALDKWNKEKEDRENRILEIQQRALEKEEAKAKFLKGVEEENQRKLEEARQKLREERERRERDEREKEERERAQRESEEKTKREREEYLKEANKRNRERFLEKRDRLETTLNKKLTKVKDLETQSTIENSGVVMRPEPYVDEEGNKKVIPIYDLNGYPVTIMSHAVDCKARINSDDGIGAAIAKRIVENPSIWAKTREEVEKEGGFLHASYQDSEGKGYARGNVISTSLVSSELRSLGHRVSDNNHLCYGFSQLNKGSILDMYYGDGTTPNNYNEDEEERDYNSVNIIDFEALTGENLKGSQETVITRYDKDGNPRRPDYIIAENGKITETMKKHAAYWTIPIININMEYYPDQE